MPELGKRLKELRLSQGLTAKELAARSGVARSLISQLETGKRQSTGLDTVYRLAKALNVPVSFFFYPESLSTSSTSEPLGTKTKSSRHSKHNEKDNISQPMYNVRDNIHPTTKEQNAPYLRLIQKAQKAGLAPDLLEELLDIIIRFRSSAN